MSAPPTPASPPPAGKQRWPWHRRVLRWLVWGLLALLLLPALLLTAGLAWLDSSAGRSWLLDRINASGTVKLQALEGSFWSRLELRGLQVETPAQRIAIDHALIAWEPYSLLVRRLDITELDVGTLDYRAKPQAPGKPPGPPPTDLTLPLALRIDRLQLGRLHVDRQLVLSALQAELSSSGRQHQLLLRQLQLPQGMLTGTASLDGRQPFALTARLGFDGELEGHALQARLQAQGPLRDLALTARLDGQPVRANATLNLDAFAEHGYQIVKSGQVAVRGLNPRSFVATLPQADLDIHLTLKPLGQGQASGSLQLENRRAASADLHAIPVTKLNTAVEYKDEALYLKGLRLDTLGDGRIMADVHLQNGQIRLAATLASLDPARFWSRQPAAKLGGKLALNGPWLAPDIELALSDSSRKVDLQTSLGWLNPERERRLAIRKLALQRGKSELELKGELGLGQALDFRLDSRFRNLDPAEWLALPAGQISGELRATGAVQPQLRARLDYRLQDSRFNGAALAGLGQLQLDDQRLREVDAWLSLGSNRVEARGSLGLTSDTLRLQLALPELQQLGRGFAGRIQGSATLSGALRNPRITTELQLGGLSTPFGVALNQGTLAASLNPDGSGPFSLVARLQQLTVEGTVIEQVDADIDGNRARHEGRLVLRLPQQTGVSAELALAGGLDERWQWQGQLRQFNGQWHKPLQLLAPVSITAGPERLDVGPLQLRYGASTLALQYLRWDGRSWLSRGAVPQLAMSDWQAFAPLPALRGDLQAAADWDLVYDGVLNGKLGVRRLQGDLGWLPAQPRARTQWLGLEQLELNLASVANRLQLAGELRANRVGQLGLKGSGQFDTGTGIAMQAPVALSVDGNIPDLARLAGLLGTDVKLGGQLKARVDVSGTPARPEFTGRLTGQQLLVTDPETGIALREGELALRLDQRKILLEKLQFRGGRGNLSGSGTLALDSEQLNAVATLKLERFTLVSKADMLLVASGQGQLKIADGALQVSGAFKADQGDIQYVDNQVPQLSDDVVVRGRETKSDERPMKMAMQLDLDLGQDFRVRGYGLDALLAGQLRLRAQPGRPLHGAGTVRVEEGGQFRAYGQKLDIERGILSFQGPLDNPGLDILAIRRNPQVDAGVKVSGTARSPRVALYSDPVVSDTEKLSWLMFGHSASGMDKSDSALLLQMLNSMAGSGGGKGLTDDLLDSVGIDEVGYRTERNEDGSNSQIFSVSKQMTRQLRVSLEKSVDGLSDAVKFSLTLSRRWALVTRIGVDKSSVDAYYTLSFD
ncbi:translocation/assembly module TamB domain-containing protein [Chitinilyticum litopenaei]|uniref:translocation/assembly module TamB domain-containing protein n=1 Tax=Chitinilyticum litopenaei TaxID=1121276 RepID=UPI00040AF366|nr:translocation/assembly module TamB domain-containing protein [Chitinilyticum litopenaei]